MDTGPFHGSGFENVYDIPQVPAEHHVLGRSSLLSVARCESRPPLSINSSHPYVPSTLRLAHLQSIVCQ